MTSDAIRAAARARFSALRVPLVQAPMAGGPATPELAAAVAAAGGQGSLAGGYLSAPALAEDISAYRRLTDSPVAVNLFVPEARASEAADVAAYRAALARHLSERGVASSVDGVGTTSDDHWEDKLDVLRQLQPEIVTFAFGLPPAAVLAELHSLGVLTGVTATTPAEAAEAVAAGAAFLIAQGCEAGGHRAQFDQAADPSAQPTAQLVAEIEAQSGPDVSIVAAGGVDGPDTAQVLLDAGAAVVQVGTLFLTADESGARSLHQDALLEAAGRPDATTVTRAFSGRAARALATSFTAAMTEHEIVGYPEVHYMTSAMRKDAAAAGDPSLLNLWSGTGYAGCRRESARELVSRFADLRR